MTTATCTRLGVALSLLSSCLPARSPHETSTAPPPIGLCTVLASPTAYFNKSVRLQAQLLMTGDYSYLSSEECRGSQIWVELPSGVESYTKPHSKVILDRLISRSADARVKHDIVFAHMERAFVTLEGSIEPNPDYTSVAEFLKFDIVKQRLENLFQYRFRVDLVVAARHMRGSEQW